MSTGALSTERGSLSERVGMEIKVAMVRAGITGRELGRRMGTSQSWVSTRLNGTTPLDLNDMQLIADALGVSVMELLPSTVRSGERSPVNVRSSRVGRTGYPDRVPPGAASPFTRQRRDRTHPGSAVPLSQRRPHSLRPRNAYPIPA